MAGVQRKQREVVLLRQVCGLAPGEIAARLGKSEGAIHGLHHRGRRAVQAGLRERGAVPVTR
jgi:RNA polymerase sigma-70 factor (ECF subfamily)